MMKKIEQILLCFLCLCLITGCGKEEAKAPEVTATPSEETITINLNDNLEVAQVRHDTVCGGWTFITNAEEIFPDRITNREEYLELNVGGDIAPHEWEEARSKLTYDAEKEQKANETFSKITSDQILGITDFEGKFQNHEFSYVYMSLELSDESQEKYPELKEQLTNHQEAFEEQIKSLFIPEGAYFRRGPCGGAAAYTEILTEELCNQYHLTCDRW